MNSQSKRSLTSVAISNRINSELHWLATTILPDSFSDTFPSTTHGWLTEKVSDFKHLGPSRTRGQKCLLMSKSCHHNEKPNATGLFTKGQNLVGAGQTSKLPSTTSGAGQIETNLGKQKRGCFDSEMI